MSFRHSIVFVVLQWGICLGLYIPPAVETHLNCTWDEFKQISRNLNELSMDFHAKSSENIVVKERSIKNHPKIFCEHGCNPEELRTNKQTCLKQIYNVLNYHGSRLNLFVKHQKPNTEKQLVHDILNKIHGLQQCLKKQHIGESASSDTLSPLPNTKIITERIAWDLTSATSLIARVFSPGDPSKH